MTRSLVTLLGIALLASGCESLIPRRDPGSVATAYAAAGRYDEAAREVAIAVRSHPRNAKLRRLAAEIHTQAGQVPQAIYHLEAAIQISPSDAQAWIQLAELEKERQNVADAYVAYRRAAESAPSRGWRSAPTPSVSTTRPAAPTRAGPSWSRTWTHSPASNEPAPVPHAGQ